MNWSLQYLPEAEKDLRDLIITRTYGCCSIKLIYLLINLLYAEMTTMMPFILTRARVEGVS